MNKSNSKIQLKYYNNCRIKSAVNSKQVGWGGKKSQETRFDVLLKYFKKNKKISLLDVGSGKSDLLEYLKKKKYKQVTYTGLDINKFFIQEAKKKYKKSKFLSGDYLNINLKNKYDIVFISGLFNLNVSNNLNYLKKIISKGCEDSKLFFIFNILSSTSKKKFNKFFYVNPKKIVKIINQHSKKYIVDHSYFDHDFTVVIYK